MPRPIVKQAHVPLSCHQAYDAFAKEMGKWWPLESRSLSANQSGKGASELTSDAQPGGEIAEISASGKRHIWGHFVDCDAPRSLEISFHMGQPKEHATLLVVSFLDLGENETLVRLQHSGFECYGPEIAGMMRDGYYAAWDEIFGRIFVAYCNTLKG